MAISIVRFSGLIQRNWLSTFFSWRLGLWDEQIEGPGLAPAIVEEVAVQSENVAGIEFVGHLDEAGVGEVDGRVGVLAHEIANGTDIGSELEADLKYALFEIFQYFFRCSVDVS